MKNSVYGSICLIGMLALGHAGGVSAEAPVLLNVKGFQVLGNNPLSNSETDAVLLPQLGAHHDLASLEKIADALEQRLRDHGFAFYRVIVPAQKPVDGVITLQILQFPLGTAKVIGNEHFSSDNILRTLPELAPGKSPDVRELSRQMGLANEHPAKRVAIVMKEGTQRDTVDADVRVRDTPPQQYFLGITGHTPDAYDQINKNTGYTRLTLGYQRSDLFDRDHAVTATYTTSPEHIDRVQQIGLFYWLPLYGYNTSLSFFYAGSDVDSGSVGSGGASFNVSGRGEFLGLKASYSLPKYRETTQSLSLSLDDKLFNSSVDTLGIANAVPDIRSRPVTLRYNARNDQPWGVVGGFAEYAFNIGGGGANDSAAYAAARPGADPAGTAPYRWAAYRYGLDASYLAANGWGFVGRFRGQYASQPLISGEQFGIGGPGSLRGLREREFAGDQGYTLSLEAVGPALFEAVQPVMFLDFGRARLVAQPSATPVGPLSDSAASLGVGLRTQWQRRLEANADLAYVLNGLANAGSTPGTTSGHTKLNFSVFYRF